MNHFPMSIFLNHLFYNHYTSLLNKPLSRNSLQTIYETHPPYLWFNSHINIGIQFKLKGSAVYFNIKGSVDLQMQNEINFSYKIQLIRQSLQIKMFTNHQNLSHQQALQHIQSLFPSLQMPTFGQNLTLKTILDSVSTRLPMPEMSMHKNVLINMKSIVDSQQYKMQRNMIEIQNYTQLEDNHGSTFDFYSQKSTNIQFNKKISDQTSQDSAMSDESEDLWWNMDSKNNSQDELEKQCFSFLD